jgi:arsenate reductase
MRFHHFDIVIKMGCNVGCPFFATKHTEDWGIYDPTGKMI